MALTKEKIQSIKKAVVKQTANNKLYLFKNEINNYLFDNKQNKPYEK